MYIYNNNDNNNNNNNHHHLCNNINNIYIITIRWICTRSIFNWSETAGILFSLYGWQRGVSRHGGQNIPFGVFTTMFSEAFGRIKG